MRDTPQLSTRSNSVAEPVVLDRPGVVAVTDAGPRARFSFRGPIGPLTVAFGIGANATPCRATRADDRASLWLGPDERLLLAPFADGAAIQTAFQRTAETTPHSLVDVSHRNVGLLIKGPHAGRLLATACPLDFDISMFPIDMCTRTIFGKAEIVVWRYAADAFHVEVWRSYRPYLAALLIEAARDV